MCVIQAVGDLYQGSVAVEKTIIGQRTILVVAAVAFVIKVVAPLLILPDRSQA